MPKRTLMGIVGPAYAGSSSGCEGPGWNRRSSSGPLPRWTSVSRVIFWMRRTWLDRRAAAKRFEGDETPGCEEGGRLSPHNTEDDCFASSRSLERDASRWRSLATRLRSRPKSRSRRSLANSLKGCDNWRHACEAEIAGDKPAKGGFVRDRRPGVPVNWLNKVRQ